MKTNYEMADGLRTPLQDNSNVIALKQNLNFKNENQEYLKIQSMLMKK